MFSLSTPCKTSTVYHSAALSTLSIAFSSRFASYSTLLSNRHSLFSPSPSHSLTSSYSTQSNSTSSSPLTLPSKQTALLFPGQGSFSSATHFRQIQQLLEHFPYCRPLVEETEECVKWNLRTNYEKVI
jgi:hypothetical protein